MKITASGSGGFAGITESYHIDTSECASEAAQALEQALEEIGFFKAPLNVAQENLGADMQRWTIEVIDGERRHSVSFIEDGSPQTADWQKLVGRIRLCSQDR
jgi:hypothetical protein